MSHSGGRLVMAGAPVPVPESQPDWLTPEDKDRRLYVCLVTLSSILETTLSAFVQNDTGEGEPPLRDPSDLSREAIRDAVLDAVAHPVAHAGRGRPRTCQSLLNAAFPCML